MLAEIPAILILVGIAAYIVLAGADFGAPFWTLTARGEQAEKIRQQTHRSMAPVWEANHVWLIFVLVVCWTAYPEVFGSLFSTLWIPLLLAALGIVLRATSYVVGGEADRPVVVWISTASSLLAPFFLGTVIGAIAGGTVPLGNAAGDPITSWLNPISITVGILAVIFCAYLAAVYLAADANRSGNPDLADAFRTRAIAAGVVSGLVAVAGLLVMGTDDSSIYDGLVSGGGLVAVIISGLAGIGAIVLLVARKFSGARVAAALATAAVVAGWGLAQSPDILPGLTIDEAAAPDNVIIALLFAIGIGLLVLIPSIALLYGLVLEGRFDTGTGEGASPAGSPVRPIDHPGRRAVLGVFALLGGGALLSLSMDGGFFLYLGVLMLFAGVVAGAITLARSLLHTAAD
ncbi:MAG: cytochrome d ubiquinol oxidase subunit II [Solirubrobacterales bacterium]